MTLVALVLRPKRNETHIGVVAIVLGWVCLRYGAIGELPTSQMCVEELGRHSLIKAYKIYSEAAWAT